MSAKNEEAMSKYQWSRLNKQQVGAYTEYYVKMELTLHGFQVYTTEVDDRGIDFVAQYSEGPFIKVQVKSLRSMGYVFMKKSHFSLAEHLYLALGLLVDDQLPALYLIPSTAWLKPGNGFTDRNYEGLASEPEWGLTVSQKNLPALQPYLFEATVERISRSLSSADA
jgi:hypothetical protein